MAGYLWKVTAGVVERVQGRDDLVEFVGIEIGVDMRGYGDRRVAHRLVQQPEVGARSPSRDNGHGDQSAEVTVVHVDGAAMCPVVSTASQWVPLERDVRD